MILEVLRLLEDTLEDGSYGVNQKLDEMDTASLFGADAQPPDVVSVINATEDPGLARGDIGSDWPVLVISQSQPATVDGIPSAAKRDATQLPAALAYITRDPDGAQASRDALYTMRAVLKSLGDWFEQAGSTRQLNSVTVLNITGVQWAEIEEDLDNGAIARAAMVLNVHARDESPT